MNTVTKLVNAETNQTFVINSEVSAAENFRNATAAGVELGRTTFMTLLNKEGYKTANGWVRVVEEVAEDMDFNGLVAELKGKGYEVAVHTTARKTYATIPLESGRVKVTPRKSFFALKFYPGKDSSADSIEKLFHVEENKARYAKLGRLSQSQILAAL